MTTCAIALAARGRQPGLATAPVSIPTLFNVFGVIALAIGVSLHGFDAANPTLASRSAPADDRRSPAEPSR